MRRGLPFFGWDACLSAEGKGPDMDFGLNRWNTYELTAPDGWEADLDAGGMEDEWMRRCGALGAYGVGGPRRTGHRASRLALGGARLNLRIHRLEDRHAAPLGAGTLMLLVAGRSGRARVDAARMLMEDVDGGRAYADRLAKCWDPKVRILAAPYADPHLFLGETDPDIIRAVIKSGHADDVCRERWTASAWPFEIRLAAGALVTDEGEADRMLATMTGHERIRFLVEYPRLAVGQRAVDACRADDDHASLLETDMTRVPDEYLREALESDRHWGIKLRVDDYRKALRETLRLERLFTGPDSQALAEVREQVEAEIAEEEE